ncbi:MAG: hypothetical protein JEZ09_10500 [Salinivirgaceae bacterium]|nr:hypothetical protein [Salinivirgaceae bacterium]
MIYFKDVLTKIIASIAIITLAFGFSLFGSDKITPNYSIQTEDTLFIYDTVYIYDTIWEYEYVHDTIWLYDTVYTKNYREHELTYMEPIKVTFIHISHFHYRTNQLVVSNNRSVQKTKKVKTSKYYNFRIKHRLKKQSHKLKKQNSSADAKLTLNPNAGSFNPTIFNRGVYSIEGYSGFIRYNNSYSENSDNELSKQIENASKNLTGFEYGIRGNFNLFQFGAQTGIGIVNLREQFNYSNILTSVDSTENFYSQELTDTIVNIIQFIDMEYYLQTGEITYLNLNDTTYQNRLDTTYYYDYDTTQNVVKHQSINTHRLLEIPLILTYEFGYARSSFQLKLGGVNQLHLISKGFTYSDKSEIIKTESQNFTLYNFALYAGAGAVFDISDNISITLDAYYKHPIKKVVTNNLIIINRVYYGANLSIRYRFNK